MTTSIPSCFNVPTPPAANILTFFETFGPVCANEVTLETSLAVDLDFDSLDLQELLLELEGEYKIQIDDAIISTWKTVADVAHTVYQLTSTPAFTASVQPPSQEMLAEMLRLQDTLNAVVDPSWRTADRAWFRAIVIEAAEAYDHHGWKWWKKQEPNVAQFRLEVVDIWHFLLSECIVPAGQAGEEDYLAQATTRIAEVMASCSTHELPLAISIPVALDELIVHASKHSTFMTLVAFNSLRRACGMTWQDIYDMYVPKNTLNLFRQANGDKEGTYARTWGGLPDNTHLEQVLNELRPLGKLTYTSIRGLLQYRYDTLVVSRAGGSSAPV